MKKEWYFDRFCGRRLAVYAEDGKILEVGVEDEKEQESVGSIYKGRVCNVVAGMQAAFVSCGLNKNCYLPLDENVTALFHYDGSARIGSAPSLKEGDEILVQMVKPSRGNKGAKVTTALSFVGKWLIYLPRTDFLGISRKITDEATRSRLLAEADALRDPGEGFIVRTAASEATRRELKAESAYLKRICRSVLEASASAPVGTVVYRDSELPVKVMRDSFGTGVTKICVGDRGLYETLLRLVRLRGDFPEKNLVLYTGVRSMFTQFGLDGQVYSLAAPRVEMDNGAYLVIDRTEAMTVIDVNSGKYIGDTDLESTAREVNLAAAREIARQVRLRNVGGIIAVDFIDMAEEAHRAEVTAELELSLMQDKAKCRVQPMNDLCVTLFTRKRTNNELLSFLLKPCPHCTRQGYVLSDVYMAMRLRSAILDRFADGYRAVIIELNRGLMESILSGHVFSAEAAGPWRDKQVYLIPHTHFNEEKFTVRGDNSGVLHLPDDAQILY